MKRINGSATISLDDLDDFRTYQDKYENIVYRLIRDCSFIDGQTKDGQLIKVNSKQLERLLFDLFKENDHGETREDHSHMEIF